MIIRAQFIDLIRQYTVLYIQVQRECKDAKMKTTSDNRNLWQQPILLFAFAKTYHSAEDHLSVTCPCCAGITECVLESIGELIESINKHSKKATKKGERR